LYPETIRDKNFFQKSLTRFLFFVKIQFLSTRKQETPPMRLFQWFKSFDARDWQDFCIFAMIVLFAIFSALEHFNVIN